jgi:hypothetical protein
LLECAHKVINLRGKSKKQVGVLWRRVGAEEVIVARYESKPCKWCGQFFYRDN